MDRYQKVEKRKPELPINENEIRITSQGLVRNYLSYATSLLQERRGREIVLKAMGQAISKTVAIAEIMKRRMPQLHQDTAISSVSIVDVWEPIEEGLLPVEQTRHVSMISITLSTKELNKNSPGYQAPSYVEETKPQYNYQQQPTRQPRAIYNAGNEDSYGRGRGRGRGGGRGWSRGGYGNYQENGGHSNWGRGGGNSNWGQGGGQSNWDQGGRQSNWGQGGGHGGQSNWGQGGGQSNWGQGGGQSNWGRGGGRGGSWGYRGAGYGRGRGGGGRGGGRSRGRMGGRPRADVNEP